MMFDPEGGKSTILHVCKTPGLQLWVALSLVTFDMLYNPKKSRLEEKIALRTFSDPVTDCRCRDCNHGSLPYEGDTINAIRKENGFKPLTGGDQIILTKLGLRIMPNLKKVSKS